MQVCHKHCPPERGGLAVLVVLAVIAAAVIARPVAHAAVTVLEVAAIVTGVVLGLGIAAGVVALAVTARRRRGRGPSPLRRGRQAHPLTGRAEQRLSAPPPRAIEPPSVRGGGDAIENRQANEYRS